MSRAIGVAGRIVSPGSALAEGADLGTAARSTAMPPENLEQQLFVMLVLGVIAVGAVPAFGSYLPACYLFSFPIVAPIAFFMLTRAREAAEIRYSICAMAVLLIAVIFSMARTFNANYADALRLRFENLDLVEDLRRRNELVEQANLDKSRFLAAASHDLRQPIHALGLFVGALRGDALPPRGYCSSSSRSRLRPRRWTDCSARSSTFPASMRASSNPISNPSPSSRCRSHLPRLSGRGESQIAGACDASLFGGRAHRSGADGAHLAQPDRQCGPLHRARPRRRRLPQARRRAPRGSLGHRPRHSRRAAGKSVPGIFPAATIPNATARKGLGLVWRSSDD